MGGKYCEVFCRWFRGRSDFPKNIQLSMFNFSVELIFITTSISILLTLLIGNTLFSFEPCATKIIIVKLIMNRVPKLFSWIRQIYCLFIAIIPSPIFLDMEDIKHVKAYWIIFICLHCNKKVLCIALYKFVGSEMNFGFGMFKLSFPTSFVLLLFILGRTNLESFYISSL